MSARFHVPDVCTHLLPSSYVDQAFQIRVAMPVARIGADERFPVLYVSEANLTFEVARIASLVLHASSQLRRFIVVGVGYPHDTPFASGVLRGRDLTPPNYPDIPGVPRSSSFAGVPGLPEGFERKNGGGDFLRFLGEELIPFVDARYPTLSEGRGLFGHSLGGRFALHALFSGAGLFDRYLVSSPGLTWGDNEHALQEARGFLACGGSARGRLFMSVAEDEEFEDHLQQSRMVSSFFRLGSFLRNAGIPGLECAFRVFTDETHASVWPVAFSHGVRFLYGAPDESLLGKPAWMRPLEPQSELKS
jgi:uncharacterized protein